MADNDQYNDEYQFSDLDALSPEPVEETQQGTRTVPPADRKGNLFASGNLKRNVLIVVGMIILAMIVYKFLGSFFADRKTTTPGDVAVAPSTPIPEQPAPTPLPQQVQPIQPVASPVAVDPNMAQKLSALEVTQQSMRSEVSSMSNQLGGVNSNVNELAAHLSQLNQAITALNAKIDEQSQEIEQLMARTKPKSAPRLVRKMVPVKKYYIQAVIPGRAWLISSNGTTLTVREGSIVPGYGLVKLIDPNQGRVMTSSGQIIRFSQSDS